MNTSEWKQNFSLSFLSLMQEECNRKIYTIQEAFVLFMSYRSQGRATRFWRDLSSATQVTARQLLEYSTTPGASTEMRKSGLLCGVKLHSDNFEEGETMNAKQTAVILRQLDFDFVELTGGNNARPEFSIARSSNESYYYKHVVLELKSQNLLDKQPVIVTGGFSSI